MRVKRPRPTSRTPVASGSSVPAWPTRRWEKIRRHRATASCEVHPASLSTTTTPNVSEPAATLRRSVIVTPRRVVSARTGPQIAEDLLDAQPVRHGRVRLEHEKGCALHPHLPTDGPLEF